MLFTNIDVLRADGTLLPGRTVAVRDGRIVYIGKSVPTADWGEVVAGKDRLLMPGFYNTHTHAAMTLLRGYGEDLPLDRWLRERIFPMEAKMTGDDVYWGAMLAIAEMLSTGTVSFSDMYFYEDRVAQAVLSTGIKANVAYSISGTDDGQPPQRLRGYQETRGLLEALQQLKTSRLRVDVAPHSEYTTTPRLLSALAELSEAYGTRVQTHLSETQEEQLACVERHGKTPAAVMRDAGLLDRPVTAAHCVWLTESDREILAEHGVTVAHCPQSNLKLGSGIAPVEAMSRQGIPVALGTDSAASNNNLNLLEELRTAALLARGISRDPCALPAGQALYMATRAGALAQGREDCGDIAVGYRADLLVLNQRAPSMTPKHDALANAVFSAGSDALEMTVVDGNVLYREGEFPTLDLERVRYRVHRCVKALLAR
ncbi:MAG TPA: amidohydrolase [Firmicutes bacterium]|nr:amidohydrolase [Bacillota bacterium]